MNLGSQFAGCEGTVGSSKVVTLKSAVLSYESSRNPHGGGAAATTAAAAAAVAAAD